MYQPGVFEYSAVRKGGFYFARKRGGDVANEENLIPFNERTESEQRETSQI